MSSAVLAPDRLIALGRIRTAVGLAGWVKVESYTDPLDNILSYPVWQLQTPTGLLALKVGNRRWTGGEQTELQVQFEGIVERNAAELLRNTDVCVYRHEMPPPPPGEYYRDDLLGLDAVTTQGERLGRLDHYLDSPAHPYMVLQDGTGKSRIEHLVPLVKGRVQSVDFSAGSMVLDWTLDWNE